MSCVGGVVQFLKLHRSGILFPRKSCRVLGAPKCAISIFRGDERSRGQMRFAVDEKTPAFLPNEHESDMLLSCSPASGVTRDAWDVRGTSPAAPPFHPRPTLSRKSHCTSGGKVRFISLMTDSGGRGTARAEDAQGTLTQSHISPSIRV